MAKTCLLQNALRKEKGREEIVSHGPDSFIESKNKRAVGSLRDIHGYNALTQTKLAASHIPSAPSEFAAIIIKVIFRKHTVSSVSTSFVTVTKRKRACQELFHGKLLMSVTGDISVMKVTPTARPGIA
jgi:hypothetical protein